MKDMLSPIRNDRGAAGIKAVIAFAIVGAAIFAAVQLVPIYWDHWDFEDSVNTEVQFAFVKYKGSDIQGLLESEFTRLLTKMGAEYEKKNIKVKVDKKKIHVEIWYSRSHSLPFYPPNPKQFYINIENAPL